MLMLKCFNAIDTYHLLNFKGIETSALWLSMVLVLWSRMDLVLILESRSYLSGVSLDGASRTRQYVVDDHVTW